MPAPRSFQEIILRLQAYWAGQGCAILQPYDMEVGAGTFHPATTLRSLGPAPWSAAYVQPSRRPADGRYGDSPNRWQHYYQYQVIIKPSPPDFQDIYLRSLTAIGIDPSCTTSASSRTTGRARPSAPGASAGRSGATGWRSASSPTSSRSAATTAARSRASSPTASSGWPCTSSATTTATLMPFNDPDAPIPLTYGDIFREAEAEYARWNFDVADTAMLLRHFEDAEAECARILAAARHRPEDRPPHRHGAPGLRPVHQGEPPLQPARRPRRHLGHRAPGLHRPRARAGQGCAPTPSSAPARAA